MNLTSEPRFHYFDHKASYLSSWRCNTIPPQLLRPPFGKSDVHANAGLQADSFVKQPQPVCEDTFVNSCKDARKGLSMFLTVTACRFVKENASSPLEISSLSEQHVSSVGGKLNHDDKCSPSPFHENCMSPSFWTCGRQYLRGLGRKTILHFLQHH